MSLRANAFSGTFSLAGANFLASLACGGVLAKGLEFLHRHGDFCPDFICAYLAGATISLVAILFLRPWISKSSGWLSLCALACSLLLWAMTYSDGTFVTDGSLWSWGKVWAFFGVLSLYFGLIVASRTFRSDLASGQSQKLSWVELGYATGGLCGLWLAQTLPNIEMSHALAYGAVSLGGAAIVDFVSASQRPLVADPLADRTQTLAPSSLQGYVKSVTLLVAMTLGVQVVAQRLASLAKNAAPLIAFDAGTTLAPLLCALFVIRYAGGARTLLMTCLCFLSMLAAIAAKQYSLGSSALVLMLIGFSAFLYEVIALCLLDRIGERSSSPGPVSLAFGLMGFVATVAYWAILLCDLSFLGCGIVVLLCFAVCLVAHLSTRKALNNDRNPLYSPPAEPLTARK